jgi:hypothetical protein
MMAMINERQRQYAQLLISPDNGTMPREGVYNGELGQFIRFVRAVQLTNGVSQTAGVLAFCPATGNMLAISDASPGAALTFAFSNTSAPGSTFLNANASKTRGIAAQIELVPSALSVTNIVGEIACGVLTAGNLPSGTLTVNTAFDLAKAYGPIQRKTYTSRWYPSGLDHTYSAYNTTPNEDHNLVYIAFRNWPATASLQARVTYVVEYTPANNIGVPPSGNVSTPVKHDDVVHTLHRSDPHWHHSIVDELKDAGKHIAKDVGGFARAAARSGLMHLGENMVKSIPRSLSLGALTL